MRDFQPFTSRIQGTWVLPREYRGYEIVITIRRLFDDGIRIETEIFRVAGVGDPLPGSVVSADRESVTTLASEDISSEALMSAQRAVDVLIAERSALAKGRR
jgi:hypothetical protein